MYIFQTPKIFDTSKIIQKRFLYLIAYIDRFYKTSISAKNIDIKKLKIGNYDVVIIMNDTLIFLWVSSMISYIHFNNI